MRLDPFWTSSSENGVSGLYSISGTYSVLLIYGVDCMSVSVH